MSLLPNSNLLSAELLKVRKRWLLYVLFLVLVLGAAVQIWLIGYATWLDEKDEAEFALGLDASRTFALPYSLTTLLDSGQYWGAILVGILTSSIVGTEYGWGTVRQAVLRGQSRNAYLTLKLLGIIVLASVMMLAALGIGVLFSWLATSLADEDFGGSLSFGEAVLMILRAGYAMVPYGLLAFALTTIGRSTTLGVAGTLMFVVIEGILVAIFGEINEITRDVRTFFPGHNVASLLAANHVDAQGSFYSLAPRNILFARELPDPKVAAALLALFDAALIAVTYYIFKRRDLGR